MNRKEEASNFYCFLTNEVREGFRTYKFVYGSKRHPNLALVVYEGILFDLGYEYSATIAMGAQLEKLFQQWLKDNQDMVSAFDNNKN